MNDSTIRRTDSVRVKLAPTIVERLEKRAEVMGMPVATVCAVAVAEWLEQKEQSKAVARMTSLELSRQLGGVMGDMMKQLGEDPELLAVIEKKQGSLILDHAATPGAK